MGRLIVYWPLAHLPRSIVLHLSLQNGSQRLSGATVFLQMGQAVVRGRVVAGFSGIVNMLGDRVNLGHALLSPSHPMVV